MSEQRREYHDAVLDGPPRDVEGAWPWPGKRALTDHLRSRSESSTEDRQRPSEGGEPLPAPHRARFEQSLGTELADVRIHADGEAAIFADQHDARAVTVGPNIYFGDGEFAPATDGGAHLLAHEVAHTVQQRGAVVTAQPKLRTTSPGSAVESEADAAADAMVGGRAAPPLSSTGAMLARVPSDAERVSTSAGNQVAGLPDGVNARDWMRQHEVRVISELRTLVAGATFALPLPELTWRGGSSAAFARQLVEHLTPTAYFMLGRILAPDSIDAAIDNGRDTRPGALGQASWSPGVVPEIGRLLLLRVVEALPRVAPRFASIVARQAPGSGPTSSPISTSAPAGIFVLGPAMPVSAVGASSHPIDGHVLAALADAAELDVATYRRNHPEAISDTAQQIDARPLRRVQFEFQVRHGAGYWLRVIDPPDATREEVARELYGDESAAHRLTAAHPLYGFERGARPDGHLASAGGLGLDNDFRPEHERAFLAAVHASGRELGITSGAQDPGVQILSSGLSEEVSLRGADRIRPTTGATGRLVVERLTLIHNRLSDMAALAPPLAQPPDSPSAVIVIGPSGTHTHPFVSAESSSLLGRIETARERVAQRAERLDDESEQNQLMWEPQTRGQLEIVNAAANGVRMAASLAREYRSLPSIYELVRDIADSYVAAAEISDMYEAAHARLEVAERKSILFPVTAAELILAQLRRAIDEARSPEVAERATAGQDVPRLERQEQELRERLARVRPLLLQNPSAATTELQAISASLAQLQTGVTIAVDLDTLERVWTQLYDSLTVVGELRALFGHSGNDVVEDGMHATLDMQVRWLNIRDAWRRDPAAGQQLLESQRVELDQLYRRMGRLIRDQRTYDAYVTFGAMVGIAIVTAGIGAYVEAAAGAAWGTTAGFVIGAATDATAFTTMSYFLIDNDPSVAGFLQQLGHNALLFGVLRGISRGYETLIGAERAMTMAGRAGRIVTEFAAMNGIALFEANQESLRRSGRPLTLEQAVSVSLQTLAFVAAVSLGTTLARSQLTELRLLGELHGRQLAVNRARGTLEQTLSVAQAQRPGGPPRPADRALQDQLIAHEDALISAERDLLQAMTRIVERADGMPEGRRPAELQRYGISPELAQTIRTGQARGDVQGHVDAMEGIRVQRLLEPAGGADFMVAREHFDMVREHFRRQGAEVVELEIRFDEPPRPEMRMAGTRSVTVRPTEGAPFRVIERAEGSAGQVAGVAEVQPRPATAATRQERLRTIAEALGRSRGEIEQRMERDPRSRREERQDAIGQLRTPHEAGRGELEGYVYEGTLAENQAAIAELRGQLAGANPDVIVGLERGGAFLTEVLAYGDPALAARVRRMPVHRAAEDTGGGKFDAAAMQAQFRQLIADGARNIALVDAYMGGRTASSLRDQIYLPLAREFPSVRFETYWLRETFGFEQRAASGSLVAPIRGQPRAGQPGADQVRSHSTEVSLVLGDDMNIAFTPGAREPIRIFNRSGDVVEVFYPREGQTTRDVLIELMNGVNPNPAQAPTTATPDGIHGLAHPQVPAQDDRR